jgi:hypothetical protein
MTPSSGKALNSPVKTKGVITKPQQQTKPVVLAKYCPQPNWCMLRAARTFHFVQEIAQAVQSLQSFLFQACPESEHNPVLVLGDNLKPNKKA